MAIFLRTFKEIFSHLFKQTKKEQTGSNKIHIKWPSRLEDHTGKKKQTTYVIFADFVSMFLYVRRLQKQFFFSHTDLY